MPYLINFLDFIPIAIIYAPLCSLRASSRDVSEMEQSAAPAGGARNPAPGRPGDPLGGHYDPSARSSLDWDWPIASSQETRTRGLCLRPSRRREAAVERREAPAFLATGTRQDGRLVRRSVLHSLALCEGQRKACPPKPEGRRRKDGVPAPLKNRGDGARLLLIPPLKGEGPARSAGGGV
jgi:hypothetical protein